MWLTTGGSIMRFENKGEEQDYIHGKFSDNFIPQVSYLGADNDAHDIKYNGTDVFYASTALNSICKPSVTHTVEIYYTPPWIKKVIPSDHCHLNGLDLGENGLPRYITAGCTLDTESAWRDHMGEGVVYDIQEEKFICKGLHSPHSPRFYRGRVWVLEAGTGRFGYVENNKFVSKVFLPSFIRGLDFYENYAIIGGSLDRHITTFKDIPLGMILKSRNLEAKCGIHVIDMTDIDNPVQIHTLEFTEKSKDNFVEKGAVIELYDVLFIPNAKRAKIKGVGDPSLVDKIYINHVKKK